jgi:hypothetical protein
MEDASTARLAREADFRSQVSEKLLKALIALLAVKDEHLLDELCIIFDHARQHGGEIGSASAEVWNGVNHQIGVLLDLASSEGEDEISEASKH